MASEKDVTVSAIKGATPGKWLAHAGTIYALNDDGTNRFSANMQPGNRYQPPRGSSWEEHHAARTSADELVANAALIVRAVNSHEKLVEALKPFAHFAEVYLKNTPHLTPTTGSVYSIERMHGSASIDVEHLKAALDALLLATGEK